MLNCVGLLFNKSPGGWPEYSLLSHPKTLILHHEPDQLEFNASITVYRGAARGELAKLPNILHSLIGVDRQVAAGEVSNCGWSRRSQPSAAKASALQSAGDVRARSHQSPQKAGAIVFNHQYDRPLVKTIMPWRYPAVLVTDLFRIGRVEGGLEAVGIGLRQFNPIDVKV